MRNPGGLTHHRGPQGASSRIPLVAPRWPRLLVALALCHSCGGNVDTGPAESGVAESATAESVLAHGPFEIATTARRIYAGAFPNQGGNPFATIEVTDFQVRWRGQTIAAAGGPDRFWRVLRLDGAPRPALLLVTEGFVLATEHDGELELLPLAAENNTLAEAQWLDAADGQPGPSMTFGIERVDLERDTLLAGGRWLRLGSRIVIDVATLAVHTVTPWVPMEPGVPVTSLSREGDEARAFSPGRTGYVLAASGYDYARDGEMAYGLLVVDIAGGSTRELRFDRARMRFADVADLDAAWIDHHYIWQTDAAGRERLTARSEFEPWPWRGRLVETGPGRWEYHVPRMREAFLDPMRTIAAALPGAQADAVRDDAFTLRIGGCTLEARAFGRDGGPDDHWIAVWPSTDPMAAVESCPEGLRSLAAAVDAELASGRHDGMILLD